MANKLLSPTVLIVLCWTFASAPVPEPISRYVTSRAPVPDVAVASRDLDKRAAKAAIEADGYERVRMLGRASNGTWRARAFRDATEVKLTVDASGTVLRE